MKSAKVRSMLGSNSVFNKKPPAAQPARSDAQPDQADRVLLPFRVPKATRTQLRMMAAELDRTQQALFEEGLNDLFKKYNKPPIA